MKKFNNKGFTLVEVLAVVAILGMVIAIMVPNVNRLIAENKENNEKQLKKSIISATKLYISDYKYNITLDTTAGSCSNTITSLNIKSIDDSNDTLNTLENSRILISTLIDEGLIETDKDNQIKNPKDNSQCLNKTTSYIEVTYDCNKKDYIYSNEPHLEWNGDCTT